MTRKAVPNNTNLKDNTLSCELTLDNLPVDIYCTIIEFTDPKDLMSLYLSSDRIKENLHKAFEKIPKQDITINNKKLQAPAFIIKNFETHKLEADKYRELKNRWARDPEEDDYRNIYEVCCINKGCNDFQKAIGIFMMIICFLAMAISRSKNVFIAGGIFFSLGFLLTVGAICMKVQHDKKYKKLESNLLTENRYLLQTVKVFNDDLEIKTDNITNNDKINERSPLIQTLSLV